MKTLYPVVKYSSSQQHNFFFNSMTNKQKLNLFYQFIAETLSNTGINGLADARIISTHKLFYKSSSLSFN